MNYKIRLKLEMLLPKSPLLRALRDKKQVEVIY
jgi:hypothetical protein